MRIRAACGLALLASLVGGAVALGPEPAFAQAAAQDEVGCCCVGEGSGQTCSEMTQRACLEKQPKMPLYDPTTNLDKAAAESEAQEKAKVTSGWRVGKCPTKGEPR